MTLISPPISLVEQLRDGEAETGADRRFGACRARAFERQEDAVEILRWMPMPVSSIVNWRDLVTVVHPKDDVAHVGEFDGIRQQVDQDLPQPVLVGVDHGR